MHPIFERWLNPGTMMDAEFELLAKGEQAIPELQQFFNGEARNSHGIPYRKLGLPLRCALEVAKRLGPIAAPLEPYLIDELRQGNLVAAQALRNMGSVSQEAIHWLALSLNPPSGSSVDLPTEAAVALIHLEHTEHPLVIEVLEHSDKASWVMKRMMAFLRKSAEKTRQENS